jgi:UDP-N-acetylmuramoyl-tripeptide--D-alanyl-D-alanine ligase
MDAAIAGVMDPARVSHFADGAAAAAEVPAWLGAGDLILLKGSRGMRLEKVAKAIEASRGVGMTLRTA